MESMGQVRCKYEQAFLTEGYCMRIRIAWRRTEAPCKAFARVYTANILKSATTREPLTLCQPKLSVFSCKDVTASHEQIKI